MLNTFTVDVEDYFHVSAFAERISPRSWDDYPSRVVTNTQRILEILQRAQVRGTFFILGWVARKYPELVRQISRDGHEIANHGYWHRLIYSQTPDEFRLDLRLSRDVLEQLVGKPVVAYRAPSFSIVNDSLWALEVLSEEGYKFDSSIFPVRHDRYGMSASERFPFGIECSAGTLWEFPPPVIQSWRMTLPVGGGGYLRLYPFHLTLKGLRTINDKFKQPFAVYIHPWEFDPEQPRIGASLRSRFRHYVNLSQTELRIIRLLDEFRFGNMSESFASLMLRAESNSSHRPEVRRMHEFHQSVSQGLHFRRRAGAPHRQVTG